MRAVVALRQGRNEQGAKTQMRIRIQHMALDGRPGRRLTCFDDRHRRGTGISVEADRVRRAVGCRRRRRPGGAQARQDHGAEAQGLHADHQCAGRHRPDRPHQDADRAGRRLFHLGLHRRYVRTAGRHAAAQMDHAGHRAAGHRDPAAVGVPGRGGRPLQELGRRGEPRRRPKGCASASPASAPTTT